MLLNEQLETPTGALKTQLESKCAWITHMSLDSLHPKKKNPLGQHPSQLIERLPNDVGRIWRSSAAPGLGSGSSQAACCLAHYISQGC